MDDMDDDARYPPNPYPSNPRRHHLHSSASSSRHRSRPSHRAPLASPPPPPNHLARRYPDDEEEDDDDDEPDDMDQPLDDDEEEDDVHAGGIRGGADVGGDDDEDDDSSLESRGKRRKIDKFAHGFEFAPRAPPPAAAPSKIPPPPRNLPADWSEDSTFVLLEAWGDRYVQNGRKSLRSDEWSEVAKIVSQASRFSRSDAQCRNRLDTLKKKYKKEKARLGEHGNSSSNWVYFKKMDFLMSSPSSPPSVGRRQQQPPPPPRLPCGVDAGEYVFAGSSFHLNRANGNDEMRDSPRDTETEDDGEDDEEDEADSDGLPPRSDDISRSSGSSFRMLADSIQKFGKIYEKMEDNKRQQMAELERMRKDFQRDLEVQKRQILERAQAEISRIREEEAGYEEEEEDRLDEDEDDDDNDDDNGGGGGGSAENLSG